MRRRALPLRRLLACELPFLCPRRGDLGTDRSTHDLDRSESPLESAFKKGRNKTRNGKKTGRFKSVSKAPPRIPVGAVKNCKVCGQGVGLVYDLTDPNSARHEQSIFLFAAICSLAMGMSARA